MGFFAPKAAIVEDTLDLKQPPSSHAFKSLRPAAEAGANSLVIVRLLAGKNCRTCASACRLQQFGRLTRTIKNQAKKNPKRKRRPNHKPDSNSKDQNTNVHKSKYR